MNDWQNCKNILCIRPDNMGDLLMSSPAIRALKESFHCKITVLTSSMAAELAKYIPCIDDTIVYDSAWVKNDSPEAIESFKTVVEKIREKNFDAAIIFTVYSQNPLPSVMLAYLAGIPRRLAYCRENPYALLTDWVADEEPYSFVQHQVRRDLALVNYIGAVASQNKLQLSIPQKDNKSIIEKLTAAGIATRKPWMILHAGVSEKKREYPVELWIKAGRKIIEETGYQLVLTGSSSEKDLTQIIQRGIGAKAFNVAGLFSLPEFICLIQKAPLVLSVNTGTIHIAAAVNTPVVVLYALSNPQHSPWKAKGKVLLFDVPEEMKSRNEVVRFVDEKLHPQNLGIVSPDEVVDAVKQVLFSGDDFIIPEMIPLRNATEQVFQ